MYIYVHMYIYTYNHIIYIYIYILSVKILSYPQKFFLILKILFSLKQIKHYCDFIYHTEYRSFWVTLNI